MFQACLGSFEVLCSQQVDHHKPEDWAYKAEDELAS